ncbi:MAG: DUF3299 domain-containing protein [Planctomycetes bacterium]|nr:DUF3299 domain-containing protein [Planctomycetota bacterium]
MSSTTTSAVGRSLERATEYRPLCTLSVVSLGLGLLSVVALFDLSLFVVPLAAVLCGMLAWRQIAARDGELAGKQLANIGVALGVAFWLGGWSLLTWQSAAEVPDGYRRLTFGELEADANQLIPEAAFQAEGQRVFMKGYMYPGSQSDDIHQFLLVRNNDDCCFGANPPLTHVVDVTMKDGLRMSFTTRPIALAGTFHVDTPAGAAAGQRPVYRLDADWIP